jgi:hypothetical protein
MATATATADRPPLPQRQVIDQEEIDQRHQGTYFSYYGSFWNVQSTQIPLNEADALGCIRRERMPGMYELAFSAENLRKDLVQSVIAGRTENILNILTLMIQATTTIRLLY